MSVARVSPGHDHYFVSKAVFMSIVAPKNERLRPVLFEFPLVRLRHTQAKSIDIVSTLGASIPTPSPLSAPWASFLL